MFLYLHDGISSIQGSNSEKNFQPAAGWTLFQQGDPMESWALCLSSDSYITFHWMELTAPLLHAAQPIYSMSGAAIHEKWECCNVTVSGGEREGGRGRGG